MDKSTFLESYASYQLAIRQVIQHLENVYETVISPENANAEDAFPAHGALEGLTYHFHGLGCTAILEGQRVEWDWLNVNGDRHDLLDPWKFWRSIKRDQGVSEQTSEFEDFKHQLRVLVEQGVLRPFSDDGHLYEVVG